MLAADRRRQVNGNGFSRSEFATLLACRGKFFQPRSRFLRLVRHFIKVNDPLYCFGEPPPFPRGEDGFPLLHTLIALDQGASASVYLCSCSNTSPKRLSQ